MAEDLDRFLADEPTEARPASIVSELWRRVLRPQRIHDAGVVTMAYGALAIAWLIYAVIFVRLGVVFHLQQPAEFYRDAVLVLLGDFVPALWLGWKIRDGRLWAAWAGLAMAIERIRHPDRLLVGNAPEIRGFLR